MGASSPAIDVVLPLESKKPGRGRTLYFFSPSITTSREMGTTYVSIVYHVVELSASEGSPAVDQPKKGARTGVNAGGISTGR